MHEYKGQDGAAQMQHFVKVDGFNAFRLPVAWQFLVESPGSPLIPANMEQYDALVKACLATGSLCIIDIHNYARWDGLIIGQGGPTDEEFANLWSQLAKQYADSPKVAMGIVNEPHEGSLARIQTHRAILTSMCSPQHHTMGPDLPNGCGRNPKGWRHRTLHYASRYDKSNSRCTPKLTTHAGNGYTSASSFVSSGSAAALATVKDTDGSTSKLIFEVHKYLDDDNSGTSIECVSNQIDKFEDLTKFLTDNNRQAILAEVGGGPTTKSCLKDVCELLTYLNDNSAVYMGYLGWGAGSFDQTYELSLTPKGDPRKGTPMKSVPLVTECFARLFSGTGSGNSSSSGGDSSYSGTGSSSGGGNIPPKPSSPNNIPPYPTNTGGSGNGGVPMSTGGAMPNGQGAYQPTTFAISYTSSPPSQSSGAATGSSPGEGQGSSPGGDQSSNTGTQNSGQPPVAAGTGGGEVADDECENDDGEEVGKDECPNDAEEPDSQPASEPVKQPAKQPVTEPAKKPVSQSASEVAEDECEADGGTWVKD